MLLDNIKRGNQIGCKTCYHVRNNITVCRDEEQQSLYYRVHSVILRCTNKKTSGYERYGGRGITVHPEWLENPMLMVKYLEQLPNYSLANQIDRIDNDGNYSPGNIQWLSPKENQMKKDSVTKVEWLGKTYSLQSWLEEFYDGCKTAGLRKYRGGASLEQLASYKNQSGRFKEYNNKSNILWVHWDGKRIHFKDFVRDYTKLSYVQANKLRLRGWTLAKLAGHTPRRGRRVRPA